MDAREFAIVNEQNMNNSWLKHNDYSCCSEEKQHLLDVTITTQLSVYYRTVLVLGDKFNDSEEHS